VVKGSLKRINFFKHPYSKKHFVREVLFSTVLLKHQLFLFSAARYCSSAATIEGALG
jgi:hypothetical protein